MAQLDLETRETDILESSPPDAETDPASPSFPEDTAAKRPEKRRFRHWFSVVLLLYFLLLLGIGAFALSSLSRFLTRYEAKAPAPAVDRYLALLQAGDFDTIYAESGFEPTVFTGKTEYISYLRELYREPEGLHTVEKASDTDGAKQYIVYRGDERVSTLYLTPAPDGGDAAWLAHTELHYLDPYTYTVSPRLHLMINGVDVASSGLSGEEVRTAYYAGIKDDSIAPSLLRYRVEGLLVPPAAEAFTDRGIAVPLLADPDEANTFTVRGGIHPGEEPDMLELAEKVAKTYSEFLSKDAAKRDALAHIYKGSYFYDAVSGFNNYWFGTHSSHGFENFKLYNLASYSPDDFTVEASFDYVVQYYKTRKYPTHYTMTFLRIDGRWQLTELLADDQTQDGTSDPTA